MDRPGRRRDLGAMLAIGLVAFAVRLLYLGAYSRSAYWDLLVLDQLHHWELAGRIAEGRGMGPYPFFRAPLYLYLLGAIRFLFGDSLWPARIFQALLGSLTASLTFSLGRLFLRRSLAVVMGLFMALYWIPVYFDGELLVTGLATFLYLACLLQVIRADRSAFFQERRSSGQWFLAGALTGLAAIARPNIMAFAAVLPVILIARELWPELSDRPYAQRRVRLGRGLLASAFFIAGVSALVVPVSGRNWVVGHDRVLIASQGGINFYLGNHEGADGRTVVAPIHRHEIPAAFIFSRSDHPWVNEEVWLSSTYAAEQKLGRKLRDSEVSDYWYDQAWNRIEQKPRAAARLFVKKLLFIFQRTEVSNNRDLEYHAKQIPLLKFLSIVNFGMAAPFILAGLLVSLPRLREFMWPLVFFLIYSSTVAAFFVTTRFRVPLLPCGALFAALWLEVFIDRLKAMKFQSWPQRLKRLSPVLASAIVLAVPVNLARPHWNDRPLRSAMHYNLGIALTEKGRHEEAGRELEQALAVKGQYPEAHFWLGLVRERQGRLHDARKEYETCLAQRPGWALAHHHLSLIYHALSQTPGDDDDKKAGYHRLRARGLEPGTGPD